MIYIENVSEDIHLIGFDEECLVTEEMWNYLLERCNVSPQFNRTVREGTDAT